MKNNRTKNKLRKGRKHHQYSALAGSIAFKNYSPARCQIINTGEKESGNDTVSKTSPDYEVKDLKDQKVSLNILAIHYGNLWEFALDRLDHQFDGFLLDFWYQGQRFRIYRKQKDKKHSYYPPLLLIKS